MRFRAFVFAMLFALPALAAGKAKVTYEDPAGDAESNDVVGLELSSDGTFIIVSMTLTAPPRPQSLFDALILGIAFDVDSNAKTGGQGFGGMHGDIPGTDFESEILSSLEDGAASKSSAASVIAVDAKGNQSTVLEASDAPATPAKGKFLTAKIAYTSMGVKPGQTIRVIPRELNDKSAGEGLFAPALLTLQ